MWRMKDQYIDQMNNDENYWMSEWYDMKEYIILEIINNLQLKDLMKYFKMESYLSNDERVDEIISKLELKTYEELTLIYKELKW